MLERLLNKFQKIILYFGLFLFFVIFLGSFTFIKDFSLGTKNIVFNIFFVTFVLLLLIGFILYIFRCIDCMSKKQLCIVTLITAVFILFIFWLLLSQFHVLPTTDSYALLDEAAYLAQNNLSSVTTQDLYGYYFGAYSNNYLMTIIFKYIFIIVNQIGVEDIYLPFYLINVVCMLISILLAWFITRKMFGFTAATKMLIFSALNPIYYGMTFWVYTCTFSIPLMMLIIYLGICIYKSENLMIKILLSFLEGIVIVLGYFIRPTAIIPFIAIIICAFILCVKRKEFKKYFVSIIILSTSIVISYYSINQLNNQYFHDLSYQNFPLTHWTMMSSHGNGMADQNDVRYTLSFPTKEEKAKATLEKTIENYQSLGIKGAIQLFGKKMMVTWSDGFSGIDIRFAQDTEFNHIYSFVSGECQGLLKAYSIAFRIMTLLFIVIKVYQTIRNNMDQKFFFLLISLIGGVIFYVLWEAKGIYSAPFLLIMFMIAQDGATLLSHYTFNHMISISKIKKISLISLCFILVFSSYLYLSLSENIEHKDYTIKSVSDSQLETIALKRGQKGTILQEFYSSKTFNRLSLRVKQGQNSSGYSLSILDQNDKVLVKQDFDFSHYNLSNKSLNFYFKDINPIGRQKYYIKIDKLHKDSDLGIYYRKGYVLDQYDGNCFVNQNRENYDLYLSVYNQYQSSYLKRNESIILFLTMISLPVLLSYGYYSYQKHMDIE